MCVCVCVHRKQTGTCADTNRSSSCCWRAVKSWEWPILKGWVPKCNLHPVWEILDFISEPSLTVKVTHVSNAEQNLWFWPPLLLILSRVTGVWQRWPVRPTQVSLLNSDTYWSQFYLRSKVENLVYSIVHTQYSTGPTALDLKTKKKQKTSTFLNFSTKILKVLRTSATCCLSWHHLCLCWQLCTSCMNTIYLSGPCKAEFIKKNTKTGLMYEVRREIKMCLCVCCRITGAAQAGEMTPGKKKK